MGTIVVFSTEISSITHLIYIIPEAQSKFNRYLVVPYETAAFIDKEQFNISSFIWFSLILVDRWDFSRKVLISKEVTETHSQYCKIISTNVIKLLFFFLKHFWLVSPRIFRDCKRPPRIPSCLPFTPVSHIAGALEVYLNTNFTVSTGTISLFSLILSCLRLEGWLPFYSCYWIHQGVFNIYYKPRLW